MRLFSTQVLIITVASVASLARSVCHNHENASSVDFEVQCWMQNNYQVKIICHSDDWTKFPNVYLDPSSEAEVSFQNCSFAETTSVKIILQSMKIKANSRITFLKHRSAPSRQNLRGLAVPRLEFIKCNITELSFDLLYDVVDIDSFHVVDSQLERIPEAFFSDWAMNLTEVHMSNNKLQKIHRNDFSQLVKVTHIDLSNNKIEDIEPGAFDNLVNLVNLRLGFNRLRGLPIGIFHQTTKLFGIDLSGNSFDKLSPDLLANTKKLSEFYMEHNNGTLSTLPHTIFKNVTTSLDTVGLTNSHLDSIPLDFFASCSRLRRLDLSRNQLRNIPAGLFDDAKNLQMLQFSNNRLESLPAHIFKNIRRLNQLDVDRNQLTFLSPEVLEDLESVKTFNAASNRLTQIEDEFLTYLKSATLIDLSHNQITFTGLGEVKSSTSSLINRPNKTFTSSLRYHNIHQSNFDRSIKLKKIDLSYNRITQIDVELIDILKYSESLSLFNNLISKINLTGIPLEIIKHETIDAAGKTTTKYTTVYVDANPLHCDCHLTDLILYLNGSKKDERYNIFEDSLFFQCASPPEFKDYDVRDIRLEELSCELKTSDPNLACSEICACRKNPKNQTLAVDCSHRNLTHLQPIIENVYNWTIELNMSGNLLQSSPSLRDSHFRHISSLDLSNNRINKVGIDLFSPNLQHLKLHGNSIKRLDSNVIGYLANSNLSSITLHDNKWTCDCEASEFLNFVKEQYSSYNFQNMTTKDLCKNVITIKVIASLTLTLVGIVAGISIALYYKYQREIKIWLYSRGWCLWFVAEDDLDKDKKYDAFISFSHKDEDFVEKEIVAKLEKGPTPYKLCLHYRDWLAGEWIPIQISRSIADSRRTIVILTPNFLDSVWGLMEFRAAHTQALREGRSRVIVIIHGEIGNVADLDREMKDYLRLNTYIKWGDPWFWDKLRYAMPRARESKRRELRRDGDEKI